MDIPLKNNFVAFGLIHFQLFSSLNVACWCVLLVWVPLVVAGLLLFLLLVLLLLQLFVVVYPLLVRSFLSITVALVVFCFSCFNFFIACFLMIVLFLLFSILSCLLCLFFFRHSIMFAVFLLSFSVLRCLFASKHRFVFWKRQFSCFCKPTFSITTSFAVLDPAKHYKHRGFNSMTSKFAERLCPIAGTFFTNCTLGAPGLVWLKPLLLQNHDRCLVSKKHKTAKNNCTNVHSS